MDDDDSRSAAAVCNTDEEQAVVAAGDEVVWEVFVGGSLVERWLSLLLAQDGVEFAAVDELDLFAAEDNDDDVDEADIEELFVVVLLLEFCVFLQRFKAASRSFASKYHTVMA